MTSPLESLPNELFDYILDSLVDHDINTIHSHNHFDYRPLSQLSQCSRFLNHRVEPLLYGTREACNAALRHGCKTGNLNAIQKTISYGTNPGTLRIYARRNIAVDLEPSADCIDIFSLQVALKARQLEAFKLLLELGAGVGPGDVANDNARKSQLQGFGQRLSEPRNVEFLIAFLEARRETPMRPDRIDQLSQAQMIARMLPLPDIVRWGTPEVLKALLDNETPTDHAILTCTDSGKKLLTPLSAAVLRRDSEVFHLLITRGAKVNVEGSAGEHRTSCTHVPSIMAAHLMAQHGDITMVQACVDAGADINRPCHIDPDPLPRNHQAKHTCTTPLLMYLHSIESWDNPIPGRVDGCLTPTEGIAYFIHNLGAEVQSPVVRLPANRYNNPEQELHNRTFGGVPSPVELLLTKWGIESLAISEFFSVVKLLIAHGGTGPDLARILVRFDGQNKTSSEIDLEALWQNFLKLLMPQLNSLTQNLKNALLRRVIVDKAYMRNRPAHPSHWIRVQAIGRASIDAIISAGADINDVCSPSAKWPQMNTPLHQVISSFIHTECLTEDNLHDHDVGYICPSTEDMVRAFGDFLAFLVNRGADPFIEDTREHRGDEKTAIDTLMSPIKAGRMEFVRGTAERGLMHLVARLRGTSEALEYTGNRTPFHRNMRWWGEYMCELHFEVDT